MSDARLLPCSSCARHVRASETACPFCSAALSLRAAPLPRTPIARLSRAALFALGTSAAAMGACTSGTGPVGGDAGTQADADAPKPAYGGPPDDDGGPFLVDAAYGGPPSDASDSDARVQPAYGGPPADF